MVVRVGTAGWSYADWEGVVYPRPKPPGFHALRYLAHYVDCMEINSSFYRLPVASHAARWVECVREHEDFVFWVKLLQDFTHAEPGSTSSMEASARAWRAGIEPLREAGRLAGVLAQFPHSFVPGPRAWGRLEWIARQFKELRLVLELRHKLWFERDAQARLRELDVSLAAIDLPFADTHPPEELDPLGAVGYLRLHGRNASAWFDPQAGRDQRYDHLYDASEVRGLIERARKLAAHREETYVVTNNHFAGKALVNAVQIASALAGVMRPAPPSLLEAYPELARCARPDAGPARPGAGSNTGSGADVAGQEELFD